MRPNIIFLLSDQLRRSALACYGDPNIATPHLDQLAADGVKFTCANSTSPICVPYRFTLMTGQYAHDRYVPGIEYRMSPAERTLADEFNDAGYETIYVGKWHLDGGHGRKNIATAVSCDRRPIPRRRQGRWQKWMAFELRNGPFDTYYFEDDDPKPRKIEKYQTDGLFELAMDYLKDREEKDKPFSCVISFEPPHPPFEAPAELEQAWADRALDLLPNFKTKTDQEREARLRNLRNYYAMTENIDANVGRLRAFLKENGLDQNTIIVFTADHGEMAGSHGLGEKQQPYEESVGVPLIVFDPSRPGLAGRTVAEPTCTEDLYPTLLGLCDLVPQQSCPGTNLAPLVRGDTDSIDRDGVLLEFVAELRPTMVWADETWRGLRTRRYKYAVKGDINGADPWQLFDLEEDPFELNNLVDDPAHADLATQLHRQLRDLLIETGDDWYFMSPAFGCDSLNDWES